MSETAAPYRVPSIMNPLRSVWAVDCLGCGKQVRMGPGSKAGILRLIAVVGQQCNACRTTTPADRAPGTVEGGGDRG